MNAIRRGMAEPTTIEYAQLEREEFSDGSYGWNVLVWWEQEDDRCEVQRIACNGEESAVALLHALMDHTGIAPLATVRTTRYPR